MRTTKKTPSKSSTRVESPHPRPSLIKLHNLAIYPRAWSGYVVSENKICFQFEGAQAKLRVVDRDVTNLGVCRDTNTYTKEVAAGGTEFGIVAVGVPLDLHPKLMVELIHSYREHIGRFPDKNLKDKLREVQTELNTLLDTE